MSDKITFRLWPPYTERVQEMADAAKLKPNQFARLATISIADGGLLNVAQRMERIENELIRLRKDFNHAVDSNKEPIS